MKEKTRNDKAEEPETPVVREEALLEPPKTGGRVRTQIYLDQHQYDFLQSETARRDLSMAQIIRECIDARLAPEEDAWAENPLLDDAPADPEFAGHTDGARRHDAIIYGAASES